MFRAFLPATEFGARTHCKSPLEHTASDLGTVPKELALKANRMSPAGIPMFYGAVDADTAVAEVTLTSDDTHVTWYEFELTAELRVVDLTMLPPEPSMFDPKLGSMRRQIRFLNMFVQQLSDRVEPEHEQIDYIPTQIVTEYLLHVHGGGDRVRGLVYESSLADGACVALDIPNAHCIDPGTPPALNSPQLQLVADSIRSDTAKAAIVRGSSRSSRRGSVMRQSCGGRRSAAACFVAACFVWVRDLLNQSKYRARNG